MTAPIAVVGSSRRTRRNGSQTSTPAASSACMSTIGVSFLKSPGVLSGPRFDGGPSARLYPHLTTVTTQSVTCQPKRPSRNAIPDVLVHVLREAGGGLVHVERCRSRVGADPELDAGAVRRRLHPQADGRGERVRLRVQDLDRLPRPGRPLDADRRRLAELDVEAEVVGERRLDHLLLHLAVQRDGELAALVVLPYADQRVLLGELGERDAQPVSVGGVGGDDDGLERRRGEVMLDAGSLLADPVADARLQPPQPRDLASAHLGPLHGIAAVEDADRGHLPGVEPLANPNCAGEHADVRDAVSGRAPFDLEDPARQVPALVPLARRQQLCDPAHQVLHAGPCEGGAEEDRVQLPCPRLLGQLGVRRAERRERRGLRPGRRGRSHRHHGRSEALLDRLQRLVVVGAGAVDLVHEQERRHAQPLQRPQQQARLRLHPFDGRDHEYGSVQHVQHPLDLRDEVRMAGRVDQVDGDVADRERHDRRLDRDAALPFERERVGLRGAGVDAADLFDRTGRVEQPLRERRLTGVYMRQDSQIERSSQQGSYPPRS